MHICMKATHEELVLLKRRIAVSHRNKRLSIKEIGRLAHVDPSQVSRIVRGEFKTISSNVVQICKVLALKLETVATPARKRDVAWSRLEASVRRLWDESPKGAEKIAAMLDKIAELKAP